MYNCLFAFAFNFICCSTFILNLTSLLSLVIRFDRDHLLFLLRKEISEKETKKVRSPPLALINTLIVLYRVRLSSSLLVAIKKQPRKVLRL